MEEEAMSYRDLHPYFANYVENPETTDSPLRKKNILDVFLDLYELEGDERININDFLDSIVEWDSKFQKFEPWERSIYDKGPFPESRRNTSLIIK